MNQVVARFIDGRTLKGHTNDFLPAKDRFHLVPLGAAPGTRPQEVKVADLKALFFVKDFQGDATHTETHAFSEHRPVPGRKLKVTFRDGEVLEGTTQGYQPGRPGFFVIPADSTSNNERCFVVSASTQDVALL